MSTISLFPELLHHIFYYATLTTSTLPSSLVSSEPTSVHPFEYTVSQQDARTMGLFTRRSLNETSRFFHSLVQEYVLEDVILKSVEAVNEFAEFVLHNRTGWWVRTLKVSFAPQWLRSTIHPTHAEGLARILTACPRLVVYEDALLSSSGGVATNVLAALVTKDSLRAIGWTGEAYPSTTDIQTLFEALPNLNILHLQGCNPGVRTGRSPPPLAPMPIHIPSLQSLTLRLAEVRGADIFPLLTAAILPSLAHLSLVGTFYFGGSVAANTAALRQFFKIHGPQLESLDIRDDGRFTPAGPLVEFLAKCTRLKEIIYPVSWTPPLCAMDKVETVGLRTIAPDLLLACSETGQAARVALEYLDAHLDVLIGGLFPRLKTIRFLDQEMLGGYSQLKALSPQAEGYLAAFHRQCAKYGITTVDSRGIAFCL
jgi:hypothetical protein